MMGQGQRKEQQDVVSDKDRVLRVQHQPPRQPQETVSDDVLAVSLCGLGLLKWRPLIGQQQLRFERHPSVGRMFPNM